MLIARKPHSETDGRWRDGRDGGISIFPGRPRPMYRNVKHDRDRLTKEGEGAADDRAGQTDFVLSSSGRLHEM